MKQRQIALLVLVVGFAGFLTCTTAQKKNPNEKDEANIASTIAPTVMPVAATTSEIEESQHGQVLSNSEKTSDTNVKNTEGLANARKKSVNRQSRTSGQVAAIRQSLEKEKSSPMEVSDHDMPSSGNDVSKRAWMEKATVGSGEEVSAEQEQTTKSDITEITVSGETSSAVENQNLSLTQQEENPGMGMKKNVSVKALVAGVFLILTVSIAFLIMKTRRQVVSQRPERTVMAPKTAMDNKISSQIKTTPVTSQPKPMVVKKEEFKPVEPTRPVVPKNEESHITTSVKPVVIEKPELPKVKPVDKPEQIGFDGLVATAQEKPVVVSGVKLRQAAAVRTKKKAVKKIVNVTPEKKVAKKAGATASGKKVKKVVSKTVGKKVVKKKTVKKGIAVKVADQKKPISSKNDNVVSMSAQKRKLTKKTAKKTGLSGKKAEIITFRKKANG